MHESKGFTLIELLVVIAIIALLMAVLMSALQRVRTQAKAVACDDGTRFLSLPEKFEINEWEMMQSFAQAQEDERLAEALLNAIRGRGAFRCFKDRVYEADIADDWYRFRDDAYRRIALEWCEWNKIDVDNDAKRRPSD